MPRVNLMIFVTEENIGGKIVEMRTRVEKAGMDVIMFLPKAGVIIGSCPSETEKEILSNLPGVDTLLTEEEFRNALLSRAETAEVP